MYYKGKKRRDSRYWWRRIQSRKYRPLLIKKSIQLVIVTAAICLLAILTRGHYGLYCLAWFFIAGVILISLRQNFTAMEPLERSQKQQDSKSKQKKIKAPSQQAAETSTCTIKEIPPKSTKTRSQKTS